MIIHVYHLPNKIFVGIFRMADIPEVPLAMVLSGNWLENKITRVYIT